MKLPSKTLPNRMDVERYRGNSATGPQWAEPIKNRKCRLLNLQVTIPDGASGDSVRSTCAVNVRPEDKLFARDRVTIDGQTYQVIKVFPLTGPFDIEGYQAALQ